MQKLLIVTGFVLIILGLILPWLLRIGVGHLPGDFFFKRGNVSFYFPIMTCLIISILVSILLWFIQK